MLMGDLRNGTQPANANGDDVPQVKIDQTTFSKRLKILYSHWQEEHKELWGFADFFAVATPTPSDDPRYLKSSTLHMWLLGYEFPATIMVFGVKQIHFICTSKRAGFLKSVKGSAKEAVDVEVIIHEKLKGEDGTCQIDAVLRSMRSVPKSGANDAAVVGYVVEVKTEGLLLEKWVDSLKGSGLGLCDVTNALSDLFAIKDPREVSFAKKAAYLTACAMKDFVVPKLERVMDEGKKVTHSSLMEETKRAIWKLAKIKEKLNRDDVDICYPPIFQSGGNFDLGPCAISNDDELYYDPPAVIVCSIGSRCNSYCSNVARTFLINADAFQSRAYEVLLKAHEAAIGAVKPGSQVSAIYLAALAVVQRDAPELVPYLTKAAGTGIGLEFHESGLIINVENDGIVKAGMMFNVSLGFEKLKTEASNPKSQVFSLLLGDTVVVTNNGRDVITQLSTKDCKDMAYYDAEEGDEEVEPRAKVDSVGKSVFSKTTLRSITKEEDKGYVPSDAMSESESEEDDSDSSLLDSESEDEDESEEEEEKRKTWEELEREATDIAYESEYDSEEERRRRRSKVMSFGKSRAAPSTVAPKRTKFR